MARMARGLVLGFVCGLIGCTNPAPPPPETPAAVVAAPIVPTDTPRQLVEAPAPIEPGAAPIVSTATAPQVTDAITEAADSVDEAVVDAVDALPIEPKPAVAAEPLLTDLGFKQLVVLETGGPSRYQRLYQRPVWPGGSSGATIGVGYDLGHALKSTIAVDWAAHPQVALLDRGAGVTGTPAKALTRSMREIVTPYPLAEDVFRDASLIVYWRIAHRAFGDGFLTLRPHAKDALVSLVYNRGGSMTGGKRLEMRVMRDQCIPKADYACLATQMRAMKRLWRGTDIEQGMNMRREAEAVLIETP